MKKSILISLLALLYGNICLPQSDHSIFYNSSNGISQHSITQVLQDEYGFLWIGTRYGLERYDGVNFKTYVHDPEVSGSISNSTVSGMLLKDDGNMLIATLGGGLNLYDYEKDSFYKYDFEGIGCVNNTLKFTSLFEDSQGDLWMASEASGLYRLRKGEDCPENYSYQPGDSSSISSDIVTEIAEDAEGNIWVGTWDKGLNLFIRETGKFVRFLPSGTNGLQGSIARVFRLLKDGRFFVGTNKGLKEVIKENGTYVFKDLVFADEKSRSFLEGKRILSIEELNGKLWLGTENKGLYEYGLKTKVVKQYLHDPNDPRTIPSNSIWSLHADRSGVLWIGTFNQGLAKIDPYEQKFSKLYRSNLSENSLNSNVISAFAEGEDGNIWIGTEGGGLNLFDRKNNSFKHFLPEEGNPNSLSEKFIITLIADSKNNLWIGTWEGGISLKPSGSNKFYQMRHDPNNPASLANNDIYNIMEDSRGWIWISTFRNGLDIYDPETAEFTHFNSQTENPNRRIGSNLVRSIIEDKDGYIWIGTEGAGVEKVLLNKDKEITFRQRYSTESAVSPISSNNIICVFQDSFGKIWIGLEGGGLDCIDPTTNMVRNYSRTKNQLSGDVVYSMEESDNKKLWVSTNAGLSELNLLTGEIRNYDESDGLQASEFYKSSSLKTKDGYLLFGGIKGFNMFHPDSILKNPVAPQVYVTNMIFSGSETDNEVVLGENKNLIGKEKLELAYNNNDFQLQLAALSFAQAGNNRYAYKLQNFDEDWRYSNDPDNIYYTNVPPGHYSFLYKGSNNDGVWSDVERLDILITPPWYKSNLAYLVYAILIIVALWFSRKNIIRNENLKNQLKLEHVQLEQMKELSRVRSRFFTNISHEFRTPLTLIISPLKSLLAKNDGAAERKQHKVMLKNAQRLLNLINQILELAKLESGQLKLAASEHDITRFVKMVCLSFGTFADKQMIRFKTDIPREKIPVYFEKDKLEKVLANLLSNAFKFTPNFGEVRISLKETEEHVVIKVSDSGKGIPQEEIDQIFDRFYQGSGHKSSLGSGIGLALSKELTELHKGFIRAHSTDGEGTTFEVWLLKGAAHLREDEICLTKLTAEEPGILQQINMETTEETSADASTVQKRKKDCPVILVAEDNKEIRQFIKYCLDDEYSLLECADGKQALELAREQIPDLILSDIMMPEMDGYELCKSLKSDEKTSHIPVMLLTAKASSESEMQGFELGANYYLTKPFNPTLLRLKIHNILQKRRNYKELVLQNKAVNLEPQPVAMSTADEEFIKKIMNCVEENLANSDFQVADLCDTLCMSKMQLYRKMKGLIGCTANEFIRTLRLKKAAQFLKQGELNIAEITYEVGFNDLQYFRKSFKKQYGVNPSEYVQKCKEGMAEVL